MLSWRSFPGNKSPNIYRLHPVLYRRFTTEVGDTPRYILASTIPRSARDSQRIAFRERVGDIPRCEMHRGSIISVPTVRRNTGRVPSIYFRWTHRQKGESRGKFNLFIAGSKRVPLHVPASLRRLLHPPRLYRVSEAETPRRSCDISSRTESSCFCSFETLITNIGMDRFVCFTLWPTNFSDLIFLLSSIVSDRHTGEIRNEKASREI